MKCKYCENDGYYIPNKTLIDKTFNKHCDDYIWVDLMVNVKDKKLALGLEHEYKLKIITKKINYCPICGRRLDKVIMPSMICDRCGKQDETVQTIIDPYDKEINEIEKEVTLCDECYQERVDSI